MREKINKTHAKTHGMWVMSKAEKNQAQKGRRRVGTMVEEGLITKKLTFE